MGGGGSDCDGSEGGLAKRDHPNETGRRVKEMIFQSENREAQNPLFRMAGINFFWTRGGGQLTFEGHHSGGRCGIGGKWTEIRLQPRRTRMPGATQNGEDGEWKL